MQHRPVSFLVLPLAVGVLASVSAPARSQEVPEYRGTIFIAAANPTCVELGYPVGSFFGFALRPEVRPLNNRGGGILLNSFTLAYTYLLPDGVPLSLGKSQGTFAGVGMSSHVGLYSFESAYRLRIRIADTKVAIEGEIDNFNGEEGCTATIRGAGTERVYSE